MQHWTNEIFDSQTNWLTQTGEARLSRYATSLPARLSAAQEVASLEDQVLKRTVEAAQQKYPNYAKKHEQAWTKGYRDMQLVLRCVVAGMMLDDLDYAAEKVLVWHRSVNASFNMTPGFIRDCYSLLKENLAVTLSPEVYRMLELHLERMIEVSCDFPEPSIPAV